ncbi:MAG TPA: hypothetical protein VMT31_03545 [Methanomicrobiales archaeon]|jgi:hypothetical protein|nr:hypothetical protein [Methanomicrobiales archaeon]
MEKQDILVVVIAIVAFAVLALVVMPMVSGRQAGPPSGGPLTPTVTPAATRPVAAPTMKQTTPTPTPTATPAWDGSVKNVGFIGQPEGQATLAPNPPIPQQPNRTRELVNFAEISGRWSGMTENVYIPTPYWVLEYTAEPLALPPDAYPVIIIQVFDVENPNRVVITPIKQTIYEEPPENPWTQKVFEGKRTYYFRIDTSFIKSYTITIKVPQEYL